MNVESPGTDIEEINDEDIWSSVAADVTIGRLLFKCSHCEKSGKLG